MADTAETSVPVKQPPSSILDQFPHKVFVGNLAFKMTDADLKEFFQAVGKVEVASVIKRGTRSLGYGFVALESPEAVAAAVAQLDKKELGGRPINVEAAKPKTELATERPPRPVRHEQGGRRRPLSRRRAEDEGEEGTQEAGEDQDAQDHKDTVNGGATAVSATATDAAAYRGERTGRGRRGGRGRRPRTRGPRGPPEGEPSATTVFVSNLPYDVDDARLRDIFAEYKPVSAKVVTRFSGRSKGFGFLEVATPDDQKRLLANGDKFESDGRRLLIKVAMSGQRPPEEGAEKARVDDEEPAKAGAGKTEA